MSVVSPNLGQRVAAQRFHELAMRPHVDAIFEAVRLAQESSTGEVEAAYRATALGRFGRVPHLTTRAVASHLKRLERNGRIVGQPINRGRYGATTLWRLNDGA